MTFIAGGWLLLHVGAQDAKSSGLNWPCLLSDLNAEDGAFHWPWPKEVSSEY